MRSDGRRLQGKPRGLVGSGDGDVARSKQVVVGPSGRGVEQDVVMVRAGRRWVSAAAGSGATGDSGFYGSSTPFGYGISIDRDEEGLVAAIRGLDHLLLLSVTRDADGLIEEVTDGTDTYIVDREDFLISRIVKA